MTSIGFRLIREAERTTRGEGEAYRIHNYITREVSSSVSVAVSELNGELPGTLNTVSDRVYYFIDAECVFTFHGDVRVRVSAGDSLFVPPNTPYSASGRFMAVLVNSPAFVLGNEVQTAV